VSGEQAIRFSRVLCLDRDAKIDAIDTVQVRQPLRLRGVR